MCEKSFRTSNLAQWPLVKYGSQYWGFSKMDKKIKTIFKRPPLVPKRKNSKILITVQNLASVPARIWSEVSSSENQWLTNEATNPSTCLQAIVHHAVFNWYLNNVQALTGEMHALQLDQLSEQILFCFTVFGVPSYQMKQISPCEIRTSVELKICISDLLTDRICLNNLFEHCLSKW